MNNLEIPVDRVSGARHDPGSPIETTILQIAAERGEQKSFCPSEVARALSDDWRPLLTPVRAAARRLAEEGRIDILRHGKPIVPAQIKGVIRLRLKQG
jgi:hypothetical protein